jgi:hypothetical protein
LLPAFIAVAPLLLIASIGRFLSFSSARIPPHRPGLTANLLRSRAARCFCENVALCFDVDFQVAQCQNVDRPNADFWKNVKLSTSMLSAFQNVDYVHMQPPDSPPRALGSSQVRIG